MQKDNLNNPKLSFTLAKNSINGEYQPPSQILLLPSSPIVGRDGRTFTYDTKEVLNSFSQDGMQLPVDIEHASEIKTKTGDPAPAVGFITDIFASATGEIWANVKWRGTVWELESGVYKYYSLAFYVDQKNKIKKLTSVGLSKQDIREIENEVISFVEGKFK